LFNRTILLMKQDSAVTHPYTVFQETGKLDRYVTDQHEHIVCFYGNIWRSKYLQTTF